MSAKSKYIGAIFIATLFFVSSFVISQIWPGPPTIHGPDPSYWPIVGRIHILFIGIGALLMLVCGSLGYIYRDLISNNKGFIIYFLPILVGLPISILFAYAFLF